VCTVSIIEVQGGFRLVTNRDEKRTRPQALPPRTHVLAEGGHATWPVDPQGGGTWVGASDSGLVMCVLNVNFGAAIHAPPPGTLESRGGLIPRLIGQAEASQAMAALLEMDLSRYAAFRMVACDVVQGRVRVGNARWDREEMRLSWHEAPVCFASSGLGDALVRPRLPLFERLVANTPSPESQDAFHRHQWPDRQPISVRMCRPDARTVSITSVDVIHGTAAQPRVNMKYEPVHEDGARQASPVPISRQ
jgi:hypothetical protein